MSGNGKAFVACCVGPEVNYVGNKTGLEWKYKNSARKLISSDGSCVLSVACLVYRR